jgi:hypothetical protein
VLTGEAESAAARFGHRRRMRGTGSGEGGGRCAHLPSEEGAREEKMVKGGSTVLLSP